jgi:outer membrane protein OmpA-like peptidoglycan-associated protein
LLALGIFAGVVGFAQPARTDTFVFHFVFDHSEIRPADTFALRHFFNQKFHMDDNTGASGGIDSIHITGYTDTVGTPEYNQQLSLRRAMAAGLLFREWLGTDYQNLIHIEGRGESEPLSGVDSENRRVTVIVWPRPAPAPPPVVAQREEPRNPDEPDTVLQLDDIRFYANTTNLTEAAEQLLPRHINYLLSLKDRFLEIDGYCNSPGPPLKTSDPLYVLSVRRAKFIYDRLIEQGFDSSRLIYRGKGNANPRNAHPTTRDEMDKNMRVEIQVFRKKPVEP